MKRGLDVPRPARAACAGALLLAGAGVLLQYLAAPDDFPTVPPGPFLLAAAGVIVAATQRWWWTPLLGVVSSVMITIGGIVSGRLLGDTSSSLLAAIGVVTMGIGLVGAFGLGLAATVREHRGLG